MEWKLTDTRKAEYDQMVRSAQELEMTIGSTQLRVYKLLKMREDIDTGVKKWWEEVIKELSLENNRDYMISEGVIKDVTKDAPSQIIKESKVGTNASTLT